MTAFTITTRRRTVADASAALSCTINRDEAAASSCVSRDEAAASCIDTAALSCVGQPAALGRVLGRDDAALACQPAGPAHDSVSAGHVVGRLPSAPLIPA